MNKITTYVPAVCLFADTPPSAKGDDVLDISSVQSWNPNDTAASSAKGASVGDIPFFSNVSILNHLQ